MRRPSRYMTRLYALFRYSWLPVSFRPHQAAFLLDDKIAAMLSKYDLIMKSDFDVFLLPGMVDFFPPFNRMVFGHQAFVLIPEVSEKIRKVAADMGLRVRWIPRFVLGIPLCCCRHALRCLQRK